MTIEQVKAMQWWNTLPSNVQEMLLSKYSVRVKDETIHPKEFVLIYAEEYHNYPILQKWEYTNFNPSSYVRLDVPKFMNNLGNQGWELVTVSSNGTYTFKRPKQEQIP